MPKIKRAPAAQTAYEWPPHPFEYATLLRVAYAISRAVEYGEDDDAVRQLLAYREASTASAPKAPSK